MKQALSRCSTRSSTQHPEEGVAVKLRDLVEPLEVTANPETAVWFQNYHNVVRLRASGFPNGPISHHFSFFLHTLMTGFRDVVGLLLDLNLLGEI